MSYDLSFERKTAILLAICTSIAAFLLVAAGFLLGMQYRRPVHPGPIPTKIPADSAAPAPRPSVAAASPVATSASLAANPDSVASVPVGPPVAPSAAPESLNAKAPAVAGYSLQFGAFREETNADAMIKQLKEKNVKAAVVPRQDAAGDTWYTVRTGDYPTLAAASAAAVPLRVSTQQSVFVRPAGRP